MTVTVIYYLMSGGDPTVTGILARRIGAQPLDKAYADFEGLGRRYHDKSVYVVDDSELMGRQIIERMRNGAKSASIVDPRMAYLNPQEALERFPTEHPSVVITDYQMKRKFGIDGDELIRQLMEMEKQF